jgi:hypothetical protein
MWIAASLAGVSGVAHADEREDLERLRATVLGLVDEQVQARSRAQQEGSQFFRNTSPLFTKVSKRHFSFMSLWHHLKRATC